MNNRHSTDLKKIFIRYYRVLLSRVYKDLLQLNHKKTTQKVGKRFEQILHKGRYITSQKADENMFSIISQQEMQIKSTVRYYIYPLK